MLEKDLEQLFCEFFAVKSPCEIDFSEAMNGMDSLDKIDLAYKIEERFNIKIDKLDNVRNYQELLSYLRSKILSVNPAN